MRTCENQARERWFVAGCLLPWPALARVATHGFCQIEVRVESVDVDAGKMSLSMKQPEFPGDLIAPGDRSFPYLVSCDNKIMVSWFAGGNCWCRLGDPFQRPEQISRPAAGLVRHICRVQMLTHGYGLCYSYV